MQKHEHQSETPTSPMPMSKAEVDELIRLTSEREAPSGSYASTADLAEALRLPEAEVQAMLARLRAQTPPDVAPIALHSQRRRDILLAVAAAFLALGIAMFMFVVSPVKVDTSPNIAPPTVVEQVQQIGPNAPAEVSPAATFVIGGAEAPSYPLQFADDPRNASTITGDVESTIAQRFPERTPVDAATERQLLIDGMKGPLYTSLPFDVRFKDANGVELSAFKGSLPVFTGDSATLEEGAKAARAKIIGDALNELDRLRKSQIER